MCIRDRARGSPRRTATCWKALAALVEPLDAARAGLHHGEDIRFRRAGAPEPDVLAVMQTGSGSIQWLDQSGQRLPTCRGPARDAPGPVAPQRLGTQNLSLIHISEPTRLRRIS